MAEDLNPFSKSSACAAEAFGVLPWRGEKARTVFSPHQVSGLEHSVALLIKSRVFVL